MANLRGGTTIGGYTVIHSGLKSAYLSGDVQVDGYINSNAGIYVDGTRKDTVWDSSLTIIGDKTKLNTTDKNTIVGAINELFTSVSSGKTQVASAITGKGVTASGSDTFATLASKIGQIETDNTGDATAVAADILSSKTAYVKGVKLTGTMVDRGNVSVNLSNNGDSYTIPSGKHGGTGKVTVSITNLSAGNIVQGITVGGVAGSYSYAPVGEVPAAGDIISGKSAFINGGAKISGTMVDRGTVNQTLTTNGSSYTITSGRHSGSGKVTVSITNLSAANIKAGVSVGGVTGTFSSDATAAATDILSGKTAYVNGNKITGSILSKGAQTYTPGTTNQTISSGQYLSGTQTISGSANLTAANLKKGINIFGVVGTYSDMPVGEVPVADDIIKGKSAFANGGSKITGSIDKLALVNAVNSASVTSNAMLADAKKDVVNQLNAHGISASTTDTFTQIANKLYADPNLKASNIVENVSVLGIIGTSKPGDYKIGEKLSMDKVIIGNVQGETKLVHTTGSGISKTLDSTIDKDGNFIYTYQGTDNFWYLRKVRGFNINDILWTVKLEGQTANYDNRSLDTDTDGNIYVGLNYNINIHKYSPSGSLLIGGSNIISGRAAKFMVYGDSIYGCTHDSSWERGVYRYKTSDLSKVWQAPYGYATYDMDIQEELGLIAITMNQSANPFRLFNLNGTQTDYVSGQSFTYMKNIGFVRTKDGGYGVVISRDSTGNNCYLFSITSDGKIPSTSSTTTTYDPVAGIEAGEFGYALYSMVSGIVYKELTSSITPIWTLTDLSYSSGAQPKFVRTKYVRHYAYSGLYWGKVGAIEAYKQII